MKSYKLVGQKTFRSLKATRGGMEMVSTLHSPNYGTRPMKEINFFVPVNLKNGVLARAHDLQYIKHLVASRFGGCTLHPWLEGIWIDATAKPVHDSIMIVVLITPDDPGLRTQVIRLADLIRIRFAQKCLFFTIRDVLSVDQPNSALHASAFDHVGILAH